VRAVGLLALMSPPEKSTSIRLGVTLIDLGLLQLTHNGAPTRGVVNGDPVEVRRDGAFPLVRVNVFGRAGLTGNSSVVDENIQATGFWRAHRR